MRRDRLPSAGPTRNASSWTLAAFPLAAAALVAALLAWPGARVAAAGGPAPAAEAPLPVPGKPSIPNGEAVFGSSCAACHTDRSRFETPAWRAGTTPAQIVRIVLGRAAGHPEAVAATLAAWEVTGYLWTLPDSGRDIRRGESLALQADAALRSDALTTLLLHWNAIQNLKSAFWVLNHGESDVDRLMRQVAGSKYTGLPLSDRQDLIDYTFASFFVWPSSW